MTPLICKKNSYDNNDMDIMLQYAKEDEKRLETIQNIALSRYSLKEATAIMHCISQGYAEAFQRFDYCVREEFITVFEDVCFSNATV